MMSAPPALKGSLRRPNASSFSSLLPIASFAEEREGESEIGGDGETDASLLARQLSEILSSRLWFHSSTIKGQREEHGGADTNGYQGGEGGNSSSSIAAADRSGGGGGGNSYVEYLLDILARGSGSDNMTGSNDM